MQFPSLSTRDFAQTFQIFESKVKNVNRWTETQLVHSEVYKINLVVAYSSAQQEAQRKFR